MHRWLYFFVAAAFVPSALLFAQASPSCSMHPRALEAMRHCYRPLLVFSPTVLDPLLTQQEKAMDSDADDMMDRNVLLLPILGDAAGYQSPLDAPSELLPAAEQEKLRRRYHVPRDRFRVLLLNEDGVVKLESALPVPMARLNGLIDTWPTRRKEMQEPNTN